MVATAANVQVAVTGSVSTAPAGTALPVAVATALNAAFLDVGYISEDGIATNLGIDTTDIKAWQNGDIVRTVQTSHSFTLKFSMLEVNELSLAVYFGNFTHGAGAADGIVNVTGSNALYRGSWVFDVIDGTERMRIVVPDGQVTEHEDMSLVNGEAIKFGVTVNCYPDVSGNKAYIYHQFAAAS